MRRPAIIAIVLALVASLVGASAAAARPRDTNGDRNAVEQHQVEVASRINALAATEKQLDQALLTLQMNVQDQQRDLVTAQKAVVAAQHRVDVADRNIGIQSRRLAALHASMVQYAVEAYVEPGGPSVGLVLNPGPVTEGLQRDGLSQIRGDQLGQLTKAIKDTRSDLEDQRDAAREARSQATTQRAKVAAQITDVHTAQVQLHKLIDTTQQRIDVELAKAIVLAQQDRQLSIQLAEQEVQLQARLYGLVPLTDSAGANGYGDGGSESAPLTGDGSNLPGGGAGVLQLCTVDGITVNCLISSELASMISAAAKDGIVLAGGGYRSPAAQIALREAHCGTSLYNVYDEPASQCSPPTAQPGESMHEVGLAVDFENSDSHATAVWQWLNLHAASFGFYNLPSEAWHWSINGN